MADSIVAKLQSRRTPADQLPYLRTYHTAALHGFCLKYAKRFTEAKFLGMGGSGVVLKLSGVSSDENEPAQMLTRANVRTTVNYAHKPFARTALCRSEVCGEKSCRHAPNSRN